MTTPLLIQSSGLTKTFGNNNALRVINLDIARGESVVLIGSSRAGKTLMLTCVMGPIQPNSGAIRTQGRDTASFSARERNRFLNQFINSRAESPIEMALTAP